MQSCIVPFDPHIDSKDINKYVISGQVSDNSDIQTVLVSKASAIGEPRYYPVSGCSVIINDDKWHSFILTESDEGKYTGKIDKKYMFPGASFKVKIVTPEGTMLESDFDTMIECPEIDKVYYDVIEVDEVNPGELNQHLQFYVDINAQNYKSRYFRWDVIETYEYHSDHPKEWFYDGSVHHISPPDSSAMVCWHTELNKNIYTLSTENLVENKYTKFPLHYITNHDPNLVYGYSILINQYALSEAAYSYWDNMRINSTDMGGLYEKQPLSITGNLHNLTDPSQEVLGFFTASLCRSQRLFLKDVAGMNIDFSGLCYPWAPEHGGFGEINPAEYPAFLMGDSIRYYMVILPEECVDCLSLGGTNIKPDFWPN